ADFERALVEGAPGYAVGIAGRVVKPGSGEIGIVIGPLATGHWSRQAAAGSAGYSAAQHTARRTDVRFRALVISAQQNAKLAGRLEQELCANSPPFVLESIIPGHDVAAPALGLVGIVPRNVGSDLLAQCYVGIDLPAKGIVV